MSITLNIHQTESVSFKEKHVDDAQWTDLYCTDVNDKIQCVTFFDVTLIDLAHAIEKAQLKQASIRGIHEEGYSI